MNPQENLAFEREWRTRAIVFAVVGALLPLAGFVVRAITIKDIPDHVRIDQLVFLDKHSTGVIVSALLIGLGAPAVGGALYYLFRAVKGRRPAIPQVALFCIGIGAIGTLISEIGFQVALTSVAGDWVRSHPTLADEISARDAFSGPGLQVLQGLGLGAQLALGFAFVIVSLNAMRVGLVTRFTGIVGIASGVFLVIPLLSPLPIVQAFWLLALALLFSHHWPSGLPEAWSSGEARPWPSQQELREERERSEQDEEPGAEAAAAAAAAAAQPSSKKRKRKRKR